MKNRTVGCARWSRPTWLCPSLPALGRSCTIIAFTFHTIVNSRRLRQNSIRSLTKDHFVSRQKVWDTSETCFQLVGNLSQTFWVTRVNPGLIFAEWTNLYNDSRQYASLPQSTGIVITRVGWLVSSLRSLWVQMFSSCVRFHCELLRGQGQSSRLKSPWWKSSNRN